MKCKDCGRTFLTGDYIIYTHHGCHCENRRNCFEKRKTMPNIKITAEVDGKQVPLETVSTETFEAIKALEKSKEIPVPVARVGNYQNTPTDRRLFLKLTNSIRENVAKTNVNVIAVNLNNGCVHNIWQDNQEIESIKLYENVRPL